MANVTEKISQKLFDPSLKGAPGIEFSKGTVTVVYKEGGVEKEKQLEYDKMEFKSAEGVLKYLDAPEETLKARLAAFTYGVDLKLKQPVRQAIVSSLPTSMDKLIEKRAKEINAMRVAAGKAEWPAEKAMEKAKAEFAALADEE